MATWKKVVVSGSAVTQLDFTDSTVLSGSIENILPAGVVSGSAQTIENLVGSTIISGSIENILPTGVVSGSVQVDGASITNKSVSFGGVSVDLGSADATPAFNLSDASAYPGDSSLTTLGTVTSGDVSAILPSGTVSGSAQTIENLVGSTVLSGSIENILPAGVVSGSVQVDGASITSNTVGFGGVSVALGGTDATPAFNLSDASAYPGDSSLTTLGTVTSGDVSAILPSGTVSGSAQTIENLVGSTVLSGSFPDAPIQSVTSTTGQTGITLAIDGSGDLTAAAAGLDITDNVEFANLTVSGDLEVAGTASFKHSQNLDVADQYITMNSGSGTGGANLDSGGIIVAQNDTLNGELFGWLDSATDSSKTRRWAVASNVPSSETGNFTAAAFMAAVLPSSTATTPSDILTDGGGTAGQGYNKEGNIFTNTSGEIWMYS